jgi:hypothetical protein
MIITGMVMILLFLGPVALLVWRREHVETYDEGRKEQRLKNLEDLNAENEKILTQYHWVDKAKGVVGIPIERAMNLVLTELQANRPHAAGPMTTPSPAASPSPAAGVTPGAAPASDRPQNKGQPPPAPAVSPAGALSPAPASSDQPGVSAIAQRSKTNP